MKKKIGLFFGLLLGLTLVGGVCAGRTYTPAYAEGEEQTSEPAPESSEPTSEEPTETPEEPEEVFECKVVLGTYDHGSIKADILEGHAGDIVTLDAKHDLFYLVEYVQVNGANLVEDEDISGRYKFALTEGENVIAAKFVVDQELLGEVAIIYEQASNKDWTNLFSVENVVRIVSWLLSGGLLIAMVRYFIKDKRIANNVERSVKETVNLVLPEMTKKVVADNIREVIEPIFNKTAAYQQDIIRVLGVFVKCFALAQEDTPEARRAILSELANLNIGDTKVIEDARAFLDKYFADKMALLQGMLDGLDKIVAKNQEVVDKAEKTEELPAPEEDSGEEEPAEPADDGTQI